MQTFYWTFISCDRSHWGGVNEAATTPISKEGQGTTTGATQRPQHTIN